MDCIVVTRGDLEVLLGLQRFKLTRMEWFEEDVKPWFPFQNVVELEGSDEYSFSFYSLYLSRISFDLPDGTMGDEERIRRLQRGKCAMRTALLSDLCPESKVPKVSTIVSYLSLLTSGLVGPESFISITVEPLHCSPAEREFVKSLTTELSKELVGEVLESPIRSKYSGRSLAPARFPLKEKHVQQVAKNYRHLEFKGNFDLKRTVNSVIQRVARRTNWKLPSLAF